MTENILITGGCGFIGSNLVNILHDQTDFNIINLDCLTYASNTEYIKYANSDRYHFIKGNILDKVLIKNIFQDFSIKKVVHMAAESHVDRSIENSHQFINTNILGTYTLLEEARQSWSNLDPSTTKFIHISTDEVYGTLGDTGFFTEESNYAPNSPYASSKASSDLLVRSYRKTYGLNTVITNCSNNFGIHQHDEKLIPTVIRSAIKEQPIPIYGTGKNVRDWIHVDDHCDAIIKILLNENKYHKYNIGGEMEIKNLDLCYKICSILDEISPRKNGQKYQELISFVTDRLGHDFRYAIKNKNITNDYNWKPKESFDFSLKNTIEWYLKKY